MVSAVVAGADQGLAEHCVEQGQVPAPLRSAPPAAALGIDRSQGLRLPGTRSLQHHADACLTSNWPGSNLRPKNASDLLQGRPGAAARSS